MRSNLGLTLAALVAGALAACAPNQQDTGSATVSVRGSADRWSGTSNTVVTLTIQKDTTITSHQLTPDGVHTWGGTFESLPTGDYTFCASAVDGALTFAPVCGPVVVKKNQMADVTLVLQQTGGQTTINTNSPLINGLILSDGAPFYGETITMTALVVDPSSSSFSYEWSTACGGARTDYLLADETHQTATLRSDCHGVETVTIKVTDNTPSHPISSIIEFGIIFSPQGANVAVTLNRAPDITSITSPDAQIKPGDRTSLTVVASDADDAALGYEWTVTCATPAGTIDPTTVFDAPDHATTGFFAAPGISGDCTATVKVSDGHGGSATGSIVVHVTPFVLAPYVGVCHDGDWAHCEDVSSYTGASSSLDGTGLHLSKTAPDSTTGGVLDYKLNFGPDAHVFGVAGMTFSSASFDAVGDAAGLTAGNPRLYATFADGGACQLDNPAVSGNTFSFDLNNGFGSRGGTPCTHTGPLATLDIIDDFGGGIGAVTLTKVVVNGISVIP